MEDEEEREEQGLSELYLEFFSHSVPSILNKGKNGDMVFCDPENEVAMILDGTDGAGGVQASQTTRDFLAQRLSRIGDLTPPIVKMLLGEALSEAAFILSKEKIGGGTTVTVVKFLKLKRKRRAIIGHVGNSRVYLFRRGRLMQVTRDDEGVVSGMHSDTLAPQMYNISLNRRDKLILLSDGLYENLIELEIKELATSGQPNLALALVNSAKERTFDKTSALRPKPDDMSAVVIEVR
ncbi:SpoIIE family protein phosphatase [Candidatus Microgenomates bacterium]|nr:SpoIIE family protein phosphatase [Candidatus Microgenomates bacterium]